VALCIALVRLCARSLWGRGPARALPTRAHRTALATLAPCTWKGHCTSERPPFLRRQACAPTCQPCPLLREVACACSALARLCARSLWGRGPARALPTRARRTALAILAPRTMEGHCTSERPPFLRRQACAFTCQPCPSLSEIALCSALARLCALSLWGRGPARALPTRARRTALAILAPCTMEGHCTSERPPFLRRQACAFTCQPCPSLSEVARACSALARLCARSLWGRGPARALPTRARRAALATLAPRTLKGHCTSERPAFLLRKPVLPRASPAPHCARWLARVARLRVSALALSGDEAQHVRFRRTAPATLAPRTLERHCTSERPPFLLRQPVLPRASPAPHCSRWLARVARLRISALALSGDEAQHVCFRRARAPRQAGDTRSMHYGRALHEREAAVPWALARAPTRQLCLSLR